jgi:hypothetical protein
MSKTQCHRVNIPISKERNGGKERRDGTKARLKSSKANIKYCNSMSSVQDIR